MDEEATTASFWLVLLVLSSVLLLLVVVSSSLWVMFGDTIGYDGGWIYKRLGVTEKAAALKTLGLAIAGIGALLGVVVANRRAKALADSAKAADDTAKAAEAGNRQRAFKDGAGHLGSDKSSVRQGGAHALFHLALEDERLRASIAGVLCAHIRETTGTKKYQEQNKDKPSTEMQSLLRLLFTTETVDEGRMERFWEGIAPDLDGGYFCGVELEGAQFRGAKLNAARFQGALLRAARFQGAYLQRVQFQWADLERAQFQGAHLDRVQFQGADLERAQFQGADLERAQIQGARLSGSQFQAASLYMAEFQQAKFGQGSEHAEIPAQDRATAKSDELAEQLKASAFHGASSETLPSRKVFEGSINERTGKKSDFSKVTFSGGVTEEKLAKVKEALERTAWLSDVPNFKEGIISNLESEVGQPESHTPPQEVIAGSYGQKDAELWIQQFRKAMARVPRTNQAA